MDRQKLISAFFRLRRRLRLIKHSRKILILSLVVGISSGLAAVVLLKFIDFIKDVLVHRFEGYQGTFLHFVCPGIGMLLSLLLLRYLIKDNIGHGVTKVLIAVSRQESKIKPHNMWSSLLTSSLTIGFGGSVGAEAPIVYTGAAIGSNFAKFMGLPVRDLTLMVGCGAAGAIAGIFKAPLAGVLFTLEILLFNISMTHMMPMLLSAVSATVVSYVFLGDSFPFQCSVTPFALANIPFYVLLGIASGFLALYFIRTTLWLEDKIGAWKSHPYIKWAVCALALGLLIALIPPLYGEGYDCLGVLLNGGNLTLQSKTPLSILLQSGWGVPLFFTLVMFLKVFSMTLTNAGGGVGGTFGPTLFIGAIGGFVLARVLNLLLASKGICLPEQNFVMVGMAALMAGVMQAPLTAIFLIAEITGGYDLFLPLIIASAISFGTTRIFERYSIYTKRIAQSGDLLTHDNDQAVLTLLKTRELVSDKYPRISEDLSLRDFVSIVSSSDVQAFAVVDESGILTGVVELDQIRSFIFDESQYDSMTVADFMQAPQDVVGIDEKMDEVMSKFDSTAAWRLPVCDDRGHYLGFVSRSRILSAYRRELKLISHD